MGTADVEDLLAERVALVSRRTVRQWVNGFGRHFAACIRRDNPRVPDKWHLDEAVIQINGRKYWPWQAVEAVQAGASDYFLKPISFDALKVAIGRALATVDLKRDVQYWQKRAQKDLDVIIVGNSPKMAHMRHLIELYAVTDSSLLIVCETGVGKELVAHAIHEKSDRNNGLFVAVDCDPAQESNVAQEFLGEEQTMRGGTRREGMLAIAQNGTIYVNNVAEMSLALQSKLVRVMETGTFRRVGGTQDLVTNVRILRRPAATFRPASPRAGSAANCSTG